MIGKFSYIDFEELFSLSIDDSLIESDYEFQGRKVPRVTKILSKMIEEEAIKMWANKLGFQRKSYKETLKYYANIGSLVHKAIDNFLDGKEVSLETPDAPFNSFLKWYGFMNNGFKLEVIGHEETIIGPYCGGTYDLLMKVNDKIFLFDFKTSSTVTYKYFLQLAAYTQLLRDIKNIHVDGVSIIQLSRTHIEYRDYILNLAFPEHKQYLDIAERTFSSLLYSYYHILYLEKGFNSEWS